MFVPVERVEELKGVLKKFVTDQQNLEEVKKCVTISGDFEQIVEDFQNFFIHFFGPKAKRKGNIDIITKEEKDTLICILKLLCNLTLQNNQACEMFFEKFHHDYTEIVEKLMQIAENLGYPTMLVLTTSFCTNLLQYGFSSPEKEKQLKTFQESIFSSGLFCSIFEYLETTDDLKHSEMTKSMFLSLFLFNIKPIHS